MYALMCESCILVVSRVFSFGGEEGCCVVVFVGSVGGVLSWCWLVRVRFAVGAFGMLFRMKKRALCGILAVLGPGKVLSRKSYESVGWRLLAFIRWEARVRSCLIRGSTRFSSHRCSSMLSGLYLYGPQLRVISSCTLGHGLLRLLASRTALRFMKLICSCEVH